MGTEQSINLAKGLLAVQSLGTQQAGLKLARQLRAQVSLEGRTTGGGEECKFQR